MQRNYMLQEQLKIIKKELGIEVRCINRKSLLLSLYMCRKMTKMRLLRNSERRFRYVLSRNY